MGADLGVPLSDLRPLCVSVAGGESRKTFTQFSKRENVKTIDQLAKQCPNVCAHRNRCPFVARSCSCHASDREKPARFDTLTMELGLACMELEALDEAREEAEAQHDEEMAVAAAGASGARSFFQHRKPRRVVERGTPQGSPIAKYLEKLLSD